MVEKNVPTWKKYLFNPSTGQQYGGGKIDYSPNARNQLTNYGGKGFWRFESDVPYELFWNKAPGDDVRYGEYAPEMNRAKNRAPRESMLDKALGFIKSKKPLPNRLGSADTMERQSIAAKVANPPVELPRYLGSADSLEARAMQGAGLQPSDTSLLRALNAPAPEIPQVNLSDLWQLLSPGVNQAYDALDASLQQGKASFQNDFSGIASRLAEAFSGSGADFANTTGQNVQDIAGTLNRLGVGDAANGPTAQMRMGQESRLANLGNMMRESLGANLGTLGSARAQMYDTFRAAGNAGRAGGMQGLAQALLGAQSDADLTRAELMSEAYGKQLDNELRLREYMQDREMKQMELELKKRELFSAMNPSADVSVTETAENPGLMQDIYSIPDTQVRNAAIQALLTSENPGAAIRKLNSANQGLTDEQKKYNLFKKLTTQVDRLGNTGTRELASSYFLPYAPEYGGVGKQVKTKRGTS